LEEMGRNLGNDELHSANYDPEVRRQLLQCMPAEAVDEGKHWVLEMIFHLLMRAGSFEGSDAN
jgi:hypothetical protein